ncbi:GNAT family N-acetyltransferase [Pararhizobium gei]|uniref:GNAT family N-acetyltransferase n=1 Tax=Pararhizobium gei TaxID=1395951 RepID=UPI0023D9834A|nr:GNAT family N-acetyltransferase [Rhizobium gei]
MGARKACANDIDFIASAYASAFAFNRARTVDYIDRTGLDSFYLIELDGLPAAVFALIETGHWFAGKVVPACNIAHVAISPEYRGTGLASTILDVAAAAATDRGAVVASLFASTRPLYRRFGFELAGSEIIYEADTSELYKIKDKFQCRRAVGDDIVSAIAPIYGKQCLAEAGVLARGPAHWNVLLQAAGNENSTFIFEKDGEDVGYIVLDTGNPECLVLRDWAALSGASARQMLKFLGTFSTVYPHVRWHGAPQDALVFAMPDKGWRLVHQEEFLMRVLSPQKALVARGYECAPANLRLDIIGDRKIHALLLSVQDGIATCEDVAKGTPDITIGLAQFATLFSGFRSARFLAKAGWINGDSTAIRRCDDIFSGPAPWVGEHF